MSAIYFIESATTGHFKVGLSRQPEARYAAIQRHCPVELTLVAILPVAARDAPRKHLLTVERQFHERYLAHHERAEWFRSNALIRADIAAIKAAAFCFSTLPSVVTEASLLRPVARGPRSPLFTPPHIPPVTLEAV